MRLAKTLSKLVPDNLLAKISYNNQKRKWLKWLVK
jgi:hypothetical protein